MEEEGTGPITQLHYRAIIARIITFNHIEIQYSILVLFRKVLRRQ
jgi:hypothetical protein